MRSFPVTDDQLDAPDGARVGAFERRGDTWFQVVDIGVRHPDYDTDFYGGAVYLWWDGEEAQREAPELWPPPDSSVRLTRVTPSGGAYAPMHGTYELFEAHLGVWKPGGWTGEITYRKVETDTIALARGYARDVTNRMFSGPNASLITYGHFQHVPNTLFFWTTPDVAHVVAHIEAQADGWRRYARNRYEEDQAAWQAEIRAAKQAEKRRQAIASVTASINRMLTEEDRQRRVEQQVATSIRQHGGEDMVGVLEDMRRPTHFRTASERERGLEDIPLDTAGMNKALGRFEKKHQHVLKGTDKKGRPVYSTGHRRKDGVWVCPTTGRGVADVLRPNVRPMLGITNKLGDGCRRRGVRIPFEENR